MMADERLFEGGKEWGVIKEGRDMEEEGGSFMLFLYCFGAFFFFLSA